MLGDGLAYWTATAAVPSHADTVLLGGKIVSVDAGNTTHQALAIHHGRIVAVGSDQDISKWIGPQTKRGRAEVMGEGGAAVSHLRTVVDSERFAAEGD